LESGHCPSSEDFSIRGIGWTQEHHSIAFHPNGTWLASGTYCNISNSSAWYRLELWNVVTGKIRHTFNDFAVSLAFSQNGKWMVSAGSTVKLWNVESGQLLHNFATENYYDSNSVALSPNGKWLASSRDRTVKLWALNPVASANTVTQIPYSEQEIAPATDLSNTSSWLIKAIVIIIGVILLVSFIWWIIHSFSPSLRPHAPRIMAGIIVGITVGITTTVAAYYLFGSPKTATVSGVILAVVAHYFIKEA
ncbi:MAG: hypothetical protein VSS75_016795, partial [Candidatus Parabeggiatoa sp.]|nr:hypothetical protein [Candidatus Parabeggiatoa sp.]